MPSRAQFLARIWLGLRTAWQEKVNVTLNPLYRPVSPSQKLAPCLAAPRPAISHALSLKPPKPHQSRSLPAKPLTQPLGLQPMGCFPCGILPPHFTLSIGRGWVLHCCFPRQASPCPARLSVFTCLRVGCFSRALGAPQPAPPCSRVQPGPPSGWPFKWLRGLQLSQRAQAFMAQSFQTLHVGLPLHKAHPISVAVR